MNERIKKVRLDKEINLSQEAFGKRLGVTGAAISRIESGDRSASDQIILAVCREFNVNETWLRTGVGEMFVPKTRSQEIADFVGDVLKGEDDNFKRRFISVLARLDESDWEIIEKMALKLVEKGQKKD